MLLPSFKHIIMKKLKAIQSTQIPKGYKNTTKALKVWQRWLKSLTTKNK